ncbi:MAG: hypothetical protein ACOXZS_00200 [Bacilli bacterium]|jgi:mRNA-degrading endonuclease RelE of RelBE toxin-antitoxin system
MKKGYVLEYQNENEFRKLERSVKKYNMLAYKKLVFDYYAQLRDGNFLGELVSVSKKEGIRKYELKLPTDDLFTKIHGELRLHYTVYKNKNVVLLTDITPRDILVEGHMAELSTYKGVMISRKNADKDIFKINLLNMLQR